MCSTAFYVPWLLSKSSFLHLISFPDKRLSFCAKFYIRIARVAKVCSQILTSFIDVQVHRLLQSEPANDMALGATAPFYRLQRAPIVETEL